MGFFYLIFLFLYVQLYKCTVNFKKLESVDSRFSGKSGKPVTLKSHNNRWKCEGQVGTLSKLLLFFSSFFSNVPPSRTLLLTVRTAGHGTTINSCKFTRAILKSEPLDTARVLQLNVRSFNAGGTFCNSLEKFVCENGFSFLIAGNSESWNTKPKRKTKLTLLHRLTELVHYQWLNINLTEPPQTKLQLYQIWCDWNIYLGEMGVGCILISSIAQFL